MKEDEIMEEKVAIMCLLWELRICDGEVAYTSVQDLSKAIEEIVL
jgi:hypothetical protein